MVWGPNPLSKAVCSHPLSYPSVNIAPPQPAALVAHKPCSLVTAANFTGGRRSVPISPSPSVACTAVQNAQSQVQTQTHTLTHPHAHTHTRGGRGDSSVLDANYPPANCWSEAPSGGGGLGGVMGGGESGRVGWRGGGSRWALWGGGYMPPRPSVGPSQAPLTSPCPPSNHTITLNLTLTFAASWFSHASHVD